MTRRWWQRKPIPDLSLIGTVQRIEQQLATHAAEFREYKLATDIRLEIIDVLATKMLPQLTQALSDSAESNRTLADSQRMLNDTFERVLAALPAPTAPILSENHVEVRPVRDYR